MSDAPLSHLRLAAAVALLLFGTAHAAAQVESPGGPGSRIIGAGVLFQKDVLHEFSNNICPGSELAGELSGGMSVLRWLAATAFGRVHGEIRADECVNGLIPPPPDSGTVTFTDYSTVEGYPYLSTGLRLTALYGAQYSGALRAYVGGEWLWGKSLISPHFGFGLSVPVKGALLVAEAERRFVSVPHERVEITYRQREPVAERREEHRREAANWALRAGLEFAVDRRRRSR